MVKRMTCVFNCAAIATELVFCGCRGTPQYGVVTCFDSHTAMMTVKDYCETVNLIQDKTFTPMWRVPETIPNEIMSSMRSLDQNTEFNYTPYLLVLLIRAHAGQIAEFGHGWTTFPVLPPSIKQKIDASYPLNLYPIHDRSSLEYIGILYLHPDVFDGYPLGLQLLLETSNPNYIDRCREKYPCQSEIQHGQYGDRL